jgi:hypothetical protein
MHRIKSLVLLLIVVGTLAACQQSRPSSEPDVDALSKALAQSGANDASKEYVPTDAFKDKAEELGLMLAERLISGCIKSSNEQAMKTCYHERMLTGFDTDGSLKNYCPQQDDMEADFKCIVLGSMARHLASKAGDDAGASLDWRRPEESANEISNRLILKQVRDCLSNGAASDPGDCVMGRITKALELTRADIEPCDALMDQDYAFGQCIGEAFSYKYIKAGLARM